MNNELLQGQIEYYNNRAVEYDEWFYRINRYDRGKDLNNKWFNEIEIIKKSLASLNNVETILEIASGTGIWIKELLLIGKKITVVESSEEMLNINKSKNCALQNRIKYIKSNIFDWKSEKKYDLIFFSFWLSHVPPEYLIQFLNQIYQLLSKNGIVFIVDSLKTSTSTAKNHFLKYEGIIQQRKLNSGKSYNICKIFYNLKELENDFANIGFKATIKTGVIIFGLRK